MIGELSPLYHNVATLLKPEDLILTRGSWIYFSPLWPGNWKWASGKLFEVFEEPVIVNYPTQKLLPVNDYKDIDLSNATGGLKLYPENESVVYEIMLGIKKGDFITHFYTPSTSNWIYRLGNSTMFPDVTDADKRYLGAKEPEDSPADAPTISIYTIKDGPPFYIRPYVTAGTYESCRYVFHINKCKVREIQPPAPNDTVAVRAHEEKKARARRIAYYSELVGF